MFNRNEHMECSRDQLEKVSKTTSNIIVAFDDNSNGEMCEKGRNVEMVQINDSDDEFENQEKIMLSK